MERSALSAAVIEELGALFMGAVRAAGPALAEADFDAVERPVQALGRVVLGRVVEQVLAARAALVPTAAPCCGGCGQPQRLVDRARVRQLQGLVGDYTLRRVSYHCAACHTGQAPFDAQVGLGAGVLSLGLARVSGRSGIEHGFDTAATSVGETLGLSVDDDAVWRLTEGVGEVAEAAVQAAITRAQQEAVVWPGVTTPQPAFMVVEVDGVQVHLDDAWHEMKVGRAAPLGPRLQHDKRSGRTHLALGPSEYCAGLENAEEFWWRVYVMACRAGLGRCPLTVVVLGDGAQWIWERARGFLGLPKVTVVEIVDIYHVYDSLSRGGQRRLRPGLRGRRRLGRAAQRPPLCRGRSPGPGRPRRVAAPGGGRRGRQGAHRPREFLHDARDTDGLSHLCGPAVPHRLGGHREHLQDPH